MYLSDDMTEDELREAAAEERELEQVPTRVVPPRVRTYQHGPWALPDEEDTFPNAVWF